MRKSESGQIVVIIILAVLLLGSLGFGGWAFMGRQDYKNNVDKKVAEASAVAVEKAKTEKDNEFVEKEKQPLKSYQGPAAFGGVTVSYPKTWSAYINEAGTGSTPLDAYLHPNFVPASNSSVYALRIQVKDTPYANELKAFDAGAKSGKVKVAAYKLPKVESALGARIDGEIVNGRQGSMILLPMRDKTLKVWTEAQQFVGDLDTLILPNLTFNP